MPQVLVRTQTCPVVIRDARGVISHTQHTGNSEEEQALQQISATTAIIHPHRKWDLHKRMKMKTYQFVTSIQHMNWMRQKYLKMCIV